MKTILSILFSVFVLTLSAQTSPAKKTNPPKVVKAPAAKDTSLCNKNWVLIAVEEWAVEAKPNAKQAGDFLRMTGDGKFKMKRNGEEKAGTWTKTGQYIFFSDEASKEKFNYKVESADAKTLKADYHVSDMHTLFTFEAK
jgi:hypothetical protein